MGEYAEMSAMRDFEQWLDDGMPGEDIRRAEPKIEKHQYKKIIRETDKAWYLEMTGGAKHWIPKSICDINEETKMLFIPLWLERKKLFG